jgi:hypothetical protein
MGGRLVASHARMAGGSIGHGLPVMDLEGVNTPSRRQNSMIAGLLAGRA